jgi:hypothetical protein
MVSTNTLGTQDISQHPIVQRYNLSLTVDNINEHGLILEDISGKSVGVRDGELRGNLIHASAPYADITVIMAKGLMLGWIQSEKMTDAGDRFLISAQALNPMPDSFHFTQPCPHLSVHGGYLDLDEKNWRCFGCDKIIPFVG